MNTENDITIFGDVAYSRKSESSFKLNAVAPTNSIRKDPDTTSSKVASWGGDNLRPQNLFAALGKLPQAKQIIKWQANTLYSGGIVYGEMSLDANGREKFTRQWIPEIENFFKKVNISRYLLESCVDYYWFGNPFDELIIDHMMIFFWLFLLTLLF
jgi:hypothetical protein